MISYGPSRSPDRSAAIKTASLLLFHDWLQFRDISLAALSGKSENAAWRHQDKRVFRQRHRAFAGQQPDVHSLERHRRARRPRARERRTDHERPPRQRVRSAAAVAVCACRQTAIGEGGGIAGARRCRPGLERRTALERRTPPARLLDAHRASPPRRWSGGVSGDASGATPPLTSPALSDGRSQAVLAGDVATPGGRAVGVVAARGVADHLQAALARRWRRSARRSRGQIPAVDRLAGHAQLAGTPTRRRPAAGRRDRPAPRSCPNRPRRSSGSRA